MSNGMAAIPSWDLTAVIPIARMDGLGKGNINKSGRIAVTHHKLRFKRRVIMPTRTPASHR